MGEVVVNYVTSTLTNGETVEFVGSYGNVYFKENGDFRFSTNVVYMVIARDGSQENVLPHIDSAWGSRFSLFRFIYKEE